MKNMFAANFSALWEKYKNASPDDTLVEFIDRFGLNWAEKVTRYVDPKTLEANRDGFFEFYFDTAQPISVRSDPRSGMFVRDPKHEAGKVEILIHMALGLEGFAELSKIKRIFTGAAVMLGEEEMPMEFSGFEEYLDRVHSLQNQLTVVWDDNLLKPSYSQSMLAAKDAIIAVSQGDNYDENAFEKLVYVILCNAHCPGAKIETQIIKAKSKEIFYYSAVVRALARKVLMKAK